VSLLLVFLAIVIAGALVWLGVAVARGRPLPAELDGGLEEPASGLPPVVLPEWPTADDVDRVRFSLAFRGYRMDQVDEVLERLRNRIADQDREIARLKDLERPEVEASE
jgi:DivIVA domain-containing protein